MVAFAVMLQRKGMGDVYFFSQFVVGGFFGDWRLAFDYDAVARSHLPWAARAARNFGVAHAALHSERLRRHCGEAVVGDGIGAGGPDHRAQRRGRLSGGAVARWYSHRLVALAVLR